ncbi:MAG: Trm112 family protein [Pseudomonadota bacterium]
MTETPSAPLDPKLLDLLVCPVTRSSLRYDQDAQELISDAAALAFPILQGIPIMLEGEARRLTDS